MDTQKKKDSKTKESKKQEVYMSWTAPSRLFKQRNKEYFTNIGAIVFLLVIILVFAREFMLIAAVLSIVFFVYALATVPPENITNKITNFGIESAGRLYRWEQLVDFWFEEQWGQQLLVVARHHAPRMVLILNDQSKEDARSVVAKHIPFKDEPDKNWVDNAATWLSEKVPLERPAEASSN